MDEPAPPRFRRSLICRYHFLDFDAVRGPAKRCENHTSGGNLLYVFDNCVLDTERRELRRGANAISLQPQVFDLLEYLIRNRERVVSKDDLIAGIWGGRIVSESALITRINAARAAIGDSGAEQRSIKTLPRKGVGFIANVREQQALEANATAVVQPGLPLPDMPSIAVLPFQEMSGDPGQDYFADGVVDEIITALSRFRQLFVIARNSSFTYKGRSVDVKQVGRELGVRYVLEGSVRKAASRVRITAQLIDAIRGTHLWADRIDGTFGDIFDLQDQVTENVVGSLAPKIEQAEIERTKHKPTDSLDAYDCYLRAMMYFHRWTGESISDAMRLFYRAIELDPGFASAHGLTAWCYVRRKLSGWMEDPAREMAELERLARRASELAGDDAVALFSAGWALVQTSSDAEAGAAMIDRALTVNPNIPAAWLVGGWTKIYLGEPETAIGFFARAIRLNPLDPLIARMHTGIAAAQFLAGHYKEAAFSAETALRQHPNDLPLLRVAAASHALVEQMPDAKRNIARICHLNPALRLSGVAELAPCRRPEDVSRYVDGMRRAGLPE